ncbi:AraC family transcriptional regulator N-terminal domain-containing protein [Sphingomonas sp.]|uniref:AraC family transcriptional regulator n=1 Tax=Sphingomonas sp. TaxID=28214 RepID=UPI003D6C7911
MRDNSEAMPVTGLHVGRLTAPVPPTPLVYDPSLCLCIRGSKHMVVGEQRFTHGEDSFLLFCADMPAIVTIDDASPEKPYTAMLINLDLDLARQVMADIDMNRIEAAPQVETGMAYGRITADLFDAVLRLVRLIERPQDIPIMRDLIQRELLFRLLSGSSGDRLRQIVRLGSPSQRIARAIAWLRSNYAKRLSIEQLADLAGMGISTLHRHFQDVTTMSPLQYQKHLRLHEARRLMLTGVEASSSAFQVGYESATQFNREYRRLFGAPPLRDVKGLRRFEPAVPL